MLDREEKLPSGKLHATQYIIVFILVVLVLGLWNLQVLGAENYRSLAEANRIRKIPVLAPRGRIFDREGRLLVDNYSSTSCFLLRDQVKDPALELPLIAEGLHLPIEQIEGTLRRFAASPKYQPIPLKQDITPDEQAFIEAHRNELPELETLEEQRRLYPRDGFAAHLIGYVGEVSEQMLANDSRYAAYDPGDVVGRSGVEATYDSLLRGEDGYREVNVNSHGKELGRIGEKLARPGQDLKLTIDLDLQQVAEQALEGKNGAIVAMDPHTGEVLAMVSRPTFDPNQFSVRLTQSYWSSILNNPDHPLLNKAIQAQLAPGSTFKIIMSVAGLQENAAQDLRVNCAGRRQLLRPLLSPATRTMDPSTFTMPFPTRATPSTTRLRIGLASTKSRSMVPRWASGRRPASTFPKRPPASCPLNTGRCTTITRKWFAGETISVGIGQGAVTATPIQLARALSGSSLGWRAAASPRPSAWPGSRADAAGCAGQLSRSR